VTAVRGALFIGDRRARRAGQREDLAALEAGFEHQPVKSAPVKSKASPKSISMFSDISRPKAFSRRESSMMLWLRVSKIL
jgi:hypothetical protein